MTNQATKKIINFYKKTEKNDDYEWIRWSDTRRRFTEDKANKFFIGVMLDQGQKAERAWDGAVHLVDNYFENKRGFWNGVADTSLSEVTNICQSGYEGNSYAINYTFNKFPKWLKSAAEHMLEKYEGDPRKIWSVTPDNVPLIYDRLKEFSGIGDALAKMGQFILVRNYGVAGGEENKHLLSIKPDNLVRRVLYRTGISPSEKIKDVIDSVEDLKLKSPSDFDAAAWIIGREFCLKSKPDCKKCPLSKCCSYNS